MESGAAIKVNNHQVLEGGRRRRKGKYKQNVEEVVKRLVRCTAFHGPSMGPTLTVDNYRCTLRSYFALQFALDYSGSDSNLAMWLEMCQRYKEGNKEASLVLQTVLVQH